MTRIDGQEKKEEENCVDITIQTLKESIKKIKEDQLEQPVVTANIRIDRKNIQNKDIKMGRKITVWIFQETNW